MPLTTPSPRPASPLARLKLSLGMRRPRPAYVHPAKPQREAAHHPAPLPARPPLRSAGWTPADLRSVLDRADAAKPQGYQPDEKMKSMLRRLENTRPPALATSALPEAAE